MFRNVVFMVAVLSSETGRNVVDRKSLSVQHCTCPKGHDFLNEIVSYCVFQAPVMSKSPEGDIVSLIGRA